MSRAETPEGPAFIAATHRFRRTATSPCAALETASLHMAHQAIEY